MYTKEQEEIALKANEQLESVHAVIRRLEYPSESSPAFHLGEILASEWFGCSCVSWAW